MFLLQRTAKDKGKNLIFSDAEALKEAKSWSTQTVVCIIMKPSLHVGVGKQQN